MIALAVISDRGDLYLDRCLAAAEEHLPSFDHTILVDDSGAGRPRSSFDESIVHPQRRGLAAAVNSAWSAAMAAGADYLFHLEEDMELLAPIDVGKACTALARRPSWAQVSYKRQAWSAEEVAAGGFMETHPDSYRDVVCSDVGMFSLHERCFTLNPCVIPRHILERGWPAGNEAEQTARLVAEGFVFAYAGSKRDAPMVSHIGHERSAGWAL